MGCQGRAFLVESKARIWVALKYGVAACTVCDVIHGKLWGHVK